MRYLTISNVLTFLRLALVPFVFNAIMHEQWVTALWLFACAALTDFLDGYCARLFNDETTLGAYLDPIADKALILSSFIALSLGRADGFVVPYWFVFFFLVREFLIMTGALLVSFYGGSHLISPTLWGKATTFLQVVFLIWLFICFLMGWQPQRTYSFFLAFLVLFSGFSFFHYLSIAFMRLQRHSA